MLSQFIANFDCDLILIARSAGFLKTVTGLVQSGLFLSGDPSGLGGHTYDATNSIVVDMLA